MGRINDRTAIALVGQEHEREKWQDTFALSHHEMQKATIQEVDGRFEVESWKADKTGLGMQLAEELTTAAPERFEGFGSRRNANRALP